jgi:hypothetical protein
MIKYLANKHSTEEMKEYALFYEVIDGSLQATNELLLWSRETNFADILPSRANLNDLSFLITQRKTSVQINIYEPKWERRNYYDPLQSLMLAIINTLKKISQLFLLARVF